jgi:hypothetical protein
MNPLYVEDDGKTVYFTMSLWDSYDVYLMKAKFEVEVGSGPGGCGFGVGLPGLAIPWTACLAGLLTWKTTRRRRTRQ